MSKLEHPLTEEELMAYADGELSGPEASKAERHIHECAHCAEVVSATKEFSRQATLWTVEDAPQRIAQNVLAKLPKRKSWWANSRVWVYSLGGTFAVAIVLIVFAASSLLRSRQAPLPTPIEMSPRLPEPPAMKIEPPMRGQQGAQKPAYGGQQAARGALRYSQGPKGLQEQQAGRLVEPLDSSGPMVIRTITLSLVTKQFDSARSLIDETVKRFQGYVDSLTLRADTGSAKGLTARLRIPATQADSALNELKKLGRLVQEQQNSSDITSQYVDLTARLSNARNSELRLLGLLRDRTGNLRDVVEMEREIASVRESIERMEAQQKDLNNKVQYVTIQLELSEEYHAELTPPVPSTTAQLRNASVDGIRSAADTIVDLAIFVLRYGPALLIWFAVISAIVILFWRYRAKWYA
jgi:hypothetical protein